MINTHALQTILARLADVCGIATEAEVPVRLVNAPKLGREEDIGTFAGLGEPFSEEVFGISLRSC